MAAVLFSESETFKVIDGLESVFSFSENGTVKKPADDGERIVVESVSVICRLLEAINSALLAPDPQLDSISTMAASTLDIIFVFETIRSSMNDSDLCEKMFEVTMLMSDLFVELTVLANVEAGDDIAVIGGDL